jgi:hypothetical protein
MREGKVPCGAQKKRRGLHRAVSAANEIESCVNPSSLRRSARNCPQAASAAESKLHRNAAERPSGRPSIGTGCYAMSNSPGPTRAWTTGEPWGFPAAPQGALASQRLNYRQRDLAQQPRSAAADSQQGRNTPSPARPRTVVGVAERTQQRMTALMRNRRADLSRRRRAARSTVGRNRRRERKYSFSYLAADSGFKPWFANLSRPWWGYVPHVSW